MSGYYQSSAQIQRDILETSFLLDYFKSRRELVSEWRACDCGDRMRKFSPFEIRKALDKRDGFEGQKRDEHYQMLSELGSHPTPISFAMLRPKPGGDTHCGAFFAEEAFVAIISELAKVTVHAAGIFRGLFSPETLEDFAMIVGFTEVQGPWFKRFFGGSNVDPAEVAAARKMLDSLDERLQKLEFPGPS